MKTSKKIRVHNSIIVLSIIILWSGSAYAKTLDVYFENIRQSNYGTIPDNGLEVTLSKLYAGNNWVEDNPASPQITTQTPSCGTCMHLQITATNNSYQDNGSAYKNLRKYNYYSTGKDYTKKLGYVVIGNLHFLYYPTSIVYTCNNIAIGGYKTDKGYDLPEIFSNLAYSKNNTLSYTQGGENNDIKILCTADAKNNVKSESEAAIFTISKAQSTNSFTLLLTDPLKEITQNSAALLISDYFNKLPIIEKKKAFSQIDTLSENDSFVIQPMAGIKLLNVQDSSFIYGVDFDMNDSSTKLMSLLTNRTPTPQLLTTSEVSQSSTNSVTTTNEHAFGGGLTYTSTTQGKTNALVAEGTFERSISVSVNYSFKHGEQKTNQTTTTYTLPRQSITVPPYCALTLAASIGKGTIKKGYFKFVVPIDPQSLNYKGCWLNNTKNDGICTNLSGNLSLPKGLNGIQSPFFFESEGIAYLSGGGSIQPGSTGDSLFSKVNITASNIDDILQPCSIAGETILSKTVETKNFKSQM